MQKSVSYIEEINSPLKGDSKANCNVCSISKAHRQLIKVTKNRNLEPIDMWAINHWGLVPILSLMGHINNLGIVNYGSQ